jgi:hypothetical protein
MGTTSFSCLQLTTSRIVIDRENSFATSWIVANFLRAHRLLLLRRAFAFQNRASNILPLHSTTSEAATMTSLASFKNPNAYHILRFDLSSPLSQSH